MPFDIGTAKQVLATTTLEYGDGPDNTVTITYRKRLVQSELLNLTEGTEIEQARTLRNSLAELIADWDITDNGEPLPPSLAVLKHIELDFLLAVFHAIVDHATPGEAGGGTSSNGSAPAATSARARKSTR
jgi:hypothetical protein